MELKKKKKKNNERLYLKTSTTVFNCNNRRCCLFQKSSVDHHESATALARAYTLLFIFTSWSSQKFLVQVKIEWLRKRSCIYTLNNREHLELATSAYLLL